MVEPRKAPLGRLKGRRGNEHGNEGSRERYIERERGHEPSGLLWFATYNESHKLCCFCRQGKGWDDAVKVGLISGVPGRKGERSECGSHRMCHGISVKD